MKLFSRITVIALALGFAAQPASATQVTCEPGSEAVCDAWCSHAGGGMSTNPDGSVTCTVVQSAAIEALQRPMNKNARSKLDGKLDNLQCRCSAQTTR
jgi:hypothetical protein